FTFIVFEKQTFLMGSPSAPAAEAGRAKDENQHPAATTPFAICDREVTVEQWQRWQQATKSSAGFDREVSPGPRHPVNNIDWFTANEYGRWLTGQAATTGPLRLEFRLPTE